MNSFSLSQKIGLLLGPLLFIIFINFPVELVSKEADKVVAIALWMIIWWITEAVSISVTALLPLVIFPLTGIMDIKEVSASYGSPIIFLFFGGFIMALALEKVNLHKRIALNIIKLTGTSPNKIILGFMISTAFLSMWISNTASTLVMLPIGLSVIHLLINDEDGFTKKDRNFALSIMLGIAFSANVGGIATIIGTPPNSVLIGLLEREYQIEISFLKWMSVGLPFSIIMIAVIYIIMVKVIYPNHLQSFNASENVIQKEIDLLGSLRTSERKVIVVFILAIFFWIFRTHINSIFSNFRITDTEISIWTAIILFIIPDNFKKGTFVLKWDDTSKIAWGILILFGGGLALASGLSKTGLVDLIATSIASYENISILAIVSLLILLMLFMTELMSNVALVAVLAPVVAGIAMGLKIPILYALIPVTMASSCAFMLPMATPPNAIVFSSGYVKVKDMVKAGVFLNLIAVGLLIILFNYFIPLVF
ncbi:SLC13 family permease [Aquimarina longa]|uniref:SLC13 family permease n=1 Tax=Aquimarina longa TaxID=1080221 RepID=UPI0007860C84|nr:SLC13 family permease [Aquimarina longa]